MRTFIASVIILLMGIGAISLMTEEFEVLTSEQARRLDISRRQPAVPDLRLIDQAGAQLHFEDWVQQKGKYLIVDFIYTRCQSLCRTLGSELQQLQRSIIERGLQSHVHLLSISFDPGYDKPAVLRQYASRMQADARVWTLATVADKRDLDVLLRTFGITVIADQWGGYQHNAALVWVAPDGRLMRVTDYGENDELLWLEKRQGLP